MIERPARNELVRIDGQLHRVIAHVQDRLVLVHVKPPHAMFLSQDGDGLIAPPDAETWRALVAERRIEPVPPAMLDESTADGDDETGKLMAQCAMLDAAGVHNGVKAMSIWLHANWSKAHVERWGRHSNVHTLRRWRTAMSRSANRAS